MRIVYLASSLALAALELLATLSVAIVAVWTGIALANGSMELHIALPLILLAPEAYWPVRRVGAEFHNAADGAESLAAIGDVIEGDASDDISDGTSADLSDGTSADLSDGTSDGIEQDTAASRVAAEGETVTVDNLSYRYGEGLPVVVDHVSARFGRGLTVVTGPSGAGKTTLLELIAGLRRPTSGSVSAPRAHLVTQRPFLSAGSLRDNLTLGGSGADDGRLIEALSDVGLGELLASLPRGLDTVIGDDGFGLSAGQRSRVALARALLSEQPMLLLDEPTAHLDPEAEAVVHDVIESLARERIVIAVSHRAGLVRLADDRFDLLGSGVLR